jgi:hypothetical protein
MFFKLNSQYRAGSSPIIGECAAFAFQLVCSTQIAFRHADAELKLTRADNATQQSRRRVVDGYEVGKIGQWIVS